MPRPPLSVPSADEGRPPWRRLPWAWLAALARDLHLGIDIVDDRGAPAGITRGAAAPARVQRRLAAVAHQAVVQAAVQQVLESGGTERVRIEDVDLAIVRLQWPSGHAALVVANDLEQRVAAAGGDLAAFTSVLARGVEAHMIQSAGQDAETFDRGSSLHRLLHDAVERGSEVEVVSACAESVFAWDGIEISGYVHSAEGQLLRQVSAPGAQRGSETPTFLPSDDYAALAPLSPDVVEQFGFDRDRLMLAIEIHAPALDPWFLVFAEGFGPLNESRVLLYVDLLREALGRASAIAETRTAWAVLQPLLGTGDPEAAAAAALGELARALPALGAALVVTAPSGAILLNVGDDDPQSSVRPFGRAARLVTTAKMSEGHGLDLSVRRGPGEFFTRREQHILDRTAGMFATWMARLLAQGTLTRERRADRRDFEQALERAAVQALRDGTDVAVMVIPVPESSSRSTLMRSWVSELRTRLRGSDLAGALSDREIGVLLCGTTAENVDAVSKRLLKHLKNGERGYPAGSIGLVSRMAGQGGDGSLVALARRHLPKSAVHEGGGRR